MTLDALQDALKDVIDADDWVSTNGIVCEVATRGDIVSRVNQQLAKLGLCVVIEPSEPGLSYTAGKINWMLQFDVFVFENVLLNRSDSGTGIRACELVAKLVHLFKPSTNPPAGCSIRSVELVEDGGPMLVYRCPMVGVMEVEEPIVEAP